MEPVSNYHLPSDLWKNVFSNLDAKKLASIARVCKLWKSLSNEETLWLKLANASKIVPRQGMKVKVAVVLDPYLSRVLPQLTDVHVYNSFLNLNETSHLVVKLGLNKTMEGKSIYKWIREYLSPNGQNCQYNDPYLSTPPADLGNNNGCTLI